MKLSNPVRFLLISPIFGAFIYTFIGTIVGCFYGDGCSEDGISMFFVFLFGAYPIFGLPIYIAGKLIYKREKATKTYIALVSSITMFIYTSPVLIFVVHRYLNVEREDNEMILTMAVSSTFGLAISAAVTGILVSKVINKCLTSASTGTL